MISGHDPAPTASLSPRSHLIQEFVETEHAYMAALAAMERCFVEVACDSCALAAALFANILELAAFERGFVRKLAAIETRHFEDGVGTLFADNELRFNVYFPFCEAFEAASAVLLANANYLRNYAHILAFHELQSYLIKPVQRLMKYPQLLNELVKHACADGRDTTLLFEGIDAIRRVTSALNETKRETENMRLKQEFLDHLVDYQSLKPKLLGELLLMDHLSVDGDLLYTHLFENVILCCSKEVRQQRRAISLNFFRPTTPEGNSGSYSYIVSSAVRISAITRIEDSSDPRINSYSLIIQFTKSKGSVPSKLPINFRNGEQLNLWKDRLDKMIALYTTIRGSHDMSEPAPSIRSSSRASISSDQSTDEMAIGSFRSLSPFLSRSNTIVSTARPASATGFMSHPFAQRIESAPTPPTIHHHQPLPTRFYSTASMPPPSTTPLPADTSLAEGEALLGLALRSMSEPFPTGEFEEPRPMSPHTRLLAPSPLSSETQESISEEEASESEAEDYPASDPAALSPSPSSSLADENSLSLNKSLASISKPAQQCSTTEVTTRHYPPPLVSRSLPATPPPLARCTTTKVTRRPSMARIRTARPPFVRMHLHTGSDPQTDTTAATLSYPTFGATLSDLRTRVARKLKVEGGAAGVRLFVVRGEAGWKDVATLETEGQFWDVLGREEVDLVVVEVHAE